MSFFQTVEDDWRVAWNDNGQQVVTLQRGSTANVRSKGVSGGAKPEYGNVPGAVDVPCDVQSASASVQERFAERSLVVTSTVYLSRDIEARASDRLLFGSRVFLVQGYQAGDMAGWPASAHVQEVPSTP